MAQNAVKTITISDMIDFILQYKLVGANDKPFYGIISEHFTNGELVLYRIESTHKPQTEQPKWNNTKGVPQCGKAIPIFTQGKR